MEGAKGARASFFFFSLTSSLLCFASSRSLSSFFFSLSVVSASAGAPVLLLALWMAAAQPGRGGEAERAGEGGQDEKAEGAPPERISGGRRKSGGRERERKRGCVCVCWGREKGGREERKGGGRERERASSAASFLSKQNERCSYGCKCVCVVCVYVLRAAGRGARWGSKEMRKRRWCLGGKSVPVHVCLCVCDWM